jgi:hypothetical protein
MRIFTFVLYATFINTGCLNAQEVTLYPLRSATKHITYQPVKEAKTVRLLPDLIIKDYSFVDENQNNIVDADENNTISLKLVNQGQGIAQGVIFKASIKKPVQGLSFTPEIKVGDLNPGQSVELKVPVTAFPNLSDGLAEFRFEAIESRGFDAFPLEMTISARQFQAPRVQIVDAVFSTDEGGKIVLNYPINLKILVQNIGKGRATDVKAAFLFLKENCVMLDNVNQFEIGSLDPGQSTIIDFPFTATRRFTDSQIPVRIELSEKYKQYARDTLVTVSLNQDLQARKEVVIEGIKTDNSDITIGSLVADVDRNIPFDSAKFGNKYALVIGNEDYKSKQTGIGDESNVEFARRDAGIFREYLLNTLGFEDENVLILKDATSAEMQRYIDLVSKLAARTDSAEVIFYYAGHGFPDENTRVPYIVPVDVTGTNLASAIPLPELYRKLETSNARRITIFLDACFSGGGRNNELLSSRGIRIKPKLEIPAGNTIVFSASSGEQSALPFSQKQHGIFTYFLLKKLQESKGNITYGELANYLQTQVSRQSLLINQKEQDPQVFYGNNNREKWTGRRIK